MVPQRLPVRRAWESCGRQSSLAARPGRGWTLLYRAWLLPSSLDFALVAAALGRQSWSPALSALHEAGPMKSEPVTTSVPRERELRSAHRCSLPGSWRRPRRLQLPVSSLPNAYRGRLRLARPQPTVILGNPSRPTMLQAWQRQTARRTHSNTSTARDASACGAAMASAPPSRSCSPLQPKPMS